MTEFTRKIKTIYFARHKNGGPTKVGITKNIKERMSVLRTQISHGLEVIAQAPGCGRDEYTIHQKLKHTKIIGEWFAPSDELDAVIKHVVETGRIPDHCIAPPEEKYVPSSGPYEYKPMPPSHAINISKTKRRIAEEARPRKRLAQLKLIALIDEAERAQ